MARRRSSSEALRSSLSAISRISNSNAFDVGWADARRRALSPRWCGCRTARSRIPARSSSSAMRAYSICCAARQLDHRSGISRRCVSTRPAARWRQHLLEQNALMRHVLIDDPQSVAPRRDDEAVVDLAQRPQIRQSASSFPAIPAVRSREQRSMRIGHSSGSRRVRSRIVEIEARRGRWQRE